MSKQNRNTTFWINETTEVGPGSYDSAFHRKENFNTG